MKDPKIVFWFRIAILFEIMWGAHAWFTWSLGSSRILQYGAYLISAFIAYQYKSKMRIRLNTKPAVVFGFFCYILAVMFFNRFSIPSLVGVFLTLYVIWVTLSDKENAEGHLNFICKGLAWIFIPGIILFLITRFISLPGPIIQRGSSEDYIFINHIFQIMRLDLGYGSDAVGRFHSIFLEPGFLGSLLSFLLFAIKYDFSKWYGKVLWVSLIISLSLAGYIITFIGYTLYLLSTGKSLGKIIVFAIGAIIVYFVSINYNDGNNYINKMIIERLQYDEEKGIAGNNRTGAGTEFYYNQAIENGDIWLGLGSERVKQINGGSSDSAGYADNIRGAGYKVFFVTRGIISALCFLMFYVFVTIGCCNIVATRIVAILLVILTFLPQSTPQSASWIFPLILGLLNYNRKKSRYIKL